MDIAILVNRAEALEPDQATTLLAHGFRKRGHRVSVLGVEDLLCLPDGSLAGRVRDVPGDLPLESIPEALAAATPTVHALDAVDLLVMRTNPGRDAARSWAHAVAFDFAHMLQERGVAVVNDPRGIRYCGTKLFLHSLPETLRPRSLVSCDPGSLIAFVREASTTTVLKPLRGTWGRDVYQVDGDDPNLTPLTEALARQGYVVAQEFLPEVFQGDTRLLLLNGEVLCVDGWPAAVNRVPPEGEFRCNVHLGGTPTRVPELTPGLLRIADVLGPRLDDLGICLAGVDVVGDRVIEVNVSSPGGLADAARFQGVEFLAPVLDAFEARV